MCLLLVVSHVPCAFFLPWLQVPAFVGVQGDNPLHARANAPSRSRGNSVVRAATPLKLLPCSVLCCRWHSTPVVVEVDGPLHACANAPDRLLGASTARTAMLRSLGYAVARVPVNEWHSLADGGKVGRETEQLAARPGGGQGHVEVEVNVANRGMHEALKSYLEDKLLMAGSLTS